jgi:hypothetical protein
MTVAKEKSKSANKTKLQEKQKDSKNEKPGEKKLIARADYRPEGWHAVVSYEGSDEDVYAELAANEISAYEAAISEIQRIKIVDEGNSSSLPI